MSQERNQSKPALYQESPFMDNAISVRVFKHPHQNTFNHWHYHKVLELVYINMGSGKKYVGNDFSHFNDGDLILVGPLLPHYSFIDPLTEGQEKYSIQMNEGFPGVSLLMLPEMKPIMNLFEKASVGISFYGQTRKKAGSKIEKLLQLQPLDQVIKILEILKDLAFSEEYNVLNSGEFKIEVNPQELARIQEIFNFVRLNFKRHISLDEAAEHAHFTSPSFARYFKKVTGKTFTQFVNDYRLVHASKMLADSTLSITDVCFESGFNNFSHFNKLFREYTGQSPSAYRSEIGKVVL